MEKEGSEQKELQDQSEESGGVDVVTVLHTHDRNYLYDNITVYNECILWKKKTWLGRTTEGKVREYLIPL